MRYSLKKSKNRRAGKGSILLIAALLLGSAAVRVGAEAGETFAKADEVDRSNERRLAENVAKSTTSTTLKRQTGIKKLLEALKERESRVEILEKQIKMRRKALEVADEEIEKRLVALEKAETSLKETLSLSSTAAEDDLARLTNVYENMKPKDAAAIFEAMEPDFAAGFLGRMRPDIAALIFAGISPEAAYTISVILAGRNANAPKI